MPTPRPPLRLLLPLALGLAAILIGAAAWLSLGPTKVAIPGIGGPFTMIAQDGKPVTEKVLQGKPTLMFFGYTHCPDICPTTLFQVSEVLRAMAPEPGVNAAFVTVDPERDTPAVLKDYLSSFDPHIMGLTGDRAAVDAMLRGYRVFSKKVPGKDEGDYTMDHSALVYLMDKQGRFVGSANLERPVADNIAQLRKLM